MCIRDSLAASLALLSGCALSKTKTDTAEDMTGKAAYQKISAEEAYEMMASQDVYKRQVSAPRLRRAAARLESGGS